MHKLARAAIRLNFNFRNHTLNGRWGNKVDELDEILANGTDEEIEAALAGLDIDGDMLFGGEDGEKEPVVEIKQEAPAAEPKQEVSETPAKTDVEGESSTKEGEAPEGFVEIDGEYYVKATGVSSKNGQHSLPYDVLVQTRERVAAAEAESQRIAAEKAELESQFAESKRVAELHSSQLKEAGIDPRKLPGEMLKDPELMKRIKDEYPELGELVSELANQIQQYGGKNQPQPAPQQPTSQNEVQDAFSNSQHLKQWMESDVDKWDMAKVIDDKLAKDPSFANKSVAERFKEVEKRVQSAFGEQHKPKPSNANSAPIPNTPTDVGTQASDLSANANLLDKDAATITAEMEGMTEAQIEAMLESASDFL
ncbi:hypothetical protein [Pseudoalteromonas sp. NZS71_1]|uniref:hypothetical protein n=1 Tax=Pseudoalteromonas sp. NZS71_1 TaxID=2792072 RepID=UPI0018CEEA59|nr:hypothetical protein [Pseudoalteromonas sp. NZS71_1]